MVRVPSNKSKEGGVKAVVRLYYEIQGDRVVLKNKKCPRCGSVMAHHMKPVERWHCGKCNYTEFVGSKTGTKK
ncbi:MAG: 30S ribosomal protein S27ae [Sulfolobaceae archaeon]|nr:30S ribosomal protein S27ae [Sulfolobales archaeon]MCG2884514.1 30S ribosomal protein S27ae [Sulfolobales archaeon]MCG2907858.1 30S ribosomal protein S27ae [Sulfolobales archaeon]MCQ4342934.1 30S ribosomal protein S27ae [Sulfolobales archaeon]MCQ4344206.1 30S ribosomal protein S27ae [Sulfolobales archaeon]